MNAVANRPIRALTLWQPWATLLVCGAKHTETRPGVCSFRNYRGLIAVHASKSCPPDVREAMRAVVDGQYPSWLPRDEARMFVDALRRVGVNRAGDLVVGAVVGTCRVTDAYRVGDRPLPEYPDRAFGDFGTGRTAIVTAQPRRLVTPIPASGSQGLWTWTPPRDLTDQDFHAADPRPLYESVPERLEAVGTLAPAAVAQPAGDGQLSLF